MDNETKMCYKSRGKMQSTCYFDLPKILIPTKEGKHMSWQRLSDVWHCCVQEAWPA